MTPNTCKNCGFTIDDNAEMAARIDGEWVHLSSRWCQAARDAYAARITRHEDELADAAEARFQELYGV